MSDVSSPTESVSKDTILRMLVWSIPVIFGAGSVVQLVNSGDLAVHEVEAKTLSNTDAIRAHSSLAGHPVAMTQINYLTTKQEEMAEEQREMREMQQDIAVNLAAICQATGASCSRR